MNSPFRDKVTLYAESPLKLRDIDEKVILDQSPKLELDPDDTIYHIILEPDINMYSNMNMRPKIYTPKMSESPEY